MNISICVLVCVHMCMYRDRYLPIYTFICMCACIFLLDSVCMCVYVCVCVNSSIYPLNKDPKLKSCWGYKMYCWINFVGLSLSHEEISFYKMFMDFTVWICSLTMLISRLAPFFWVCPSPSPGSSPPLFLTASVDYKEHSPTPSSPCICIRLFLFTLTINLLFEITYFCLYVLCRKLECMFFEEEMCQLVVQSTENQELQ